MGEAPQLPLTSADTDTAELSDEVIYLSLLIEDPELVAALSAYPEGCRRDEFALSALRIGILTLKQGHRQEQVADFETIERAIREIERQVSGLDQTQTSTNTLNSSSENIPQRVRIMQTALANQIDLLTDMLKDLRSAMDRVTN